MEDSFRYYGIQIPKSTKAKQELAGNIAESHLRKQFDASAEDVMANPDKARAFGSEPKRQPTQSNSANAISTSIAKAKASGMSFDEWVKTSQSSDNALYHYTNANVGDTLKPRPDVELAEMNYLGDGVYLTNQRYGYEGTTELLAFPSKDLRILDITTEAAEEKFLKQISKEIGTPVARSGGGLYDDLRLMASKIRENHQKVKDAVAKVSDGYDGIKANFAKYTDDDNYYELVIKQEVPVKTRSQLKAEWDKVSE